MIWTGENLQLTVMSIKENEEAGLEIHEGIDQFIRIVEGQGVCKMGETKDNLNFERAITTNDAVLVPENMWHNIINTGGKPLKLYTLYSTPEHKEGTSNPASSFSLMDITVSCKFSPVQIVVRKLLFWIVASSMSNI